MTIIEAIRKIDELKPNTYTQEEKVKWLSDIDSMIKRDVIDTHEGSQFYFFSGYNQDTPVDTKLLAHGFDEMYILWLESEIDYHNGEYAKYNNTITRYNDIFKNFENDYNRKHMPKGRKIRYF